MSYRVNVKDECGEIVGRVEYNTLLDYWDGYNFTCGSTGRHLGITRLKNGSCVLIHGTQCQGEQDYAEVVTAAEALQAILRTDNTELLKESKFQDLRKLAIEKENLCSEEFV